MAKFVGRGVNVGFGKETTRGTSVAPSSWFAKTSISFDDKMETVVDEGNYGTIVDSTGHEVVKRFSEGEIMGSLGVNSISLPLYAMLGAVTTATASGTAKTHTMTLSESYQSPSLTIAMDDPVQDKRFALGVINSMTIKVEPKKYVEVSMTFMGKQGVNSSETVAFTEDYLLKATHTNILFASDLAGLDVAVAGGTCIKSFELTLERTLSEDECISSIAPSDYISTVFAISRSMEVTYENEADYKTKALTGTTQAMRISILNGDVIIGGGTASPELEIDLAKVGFTEWSRTVSTNEIVTQSVGFKGFYSIADAKAIIARLTNTVASI